MSVTAAMSDRSVDDSSPLVQLAFKSGQHWPHLLKAQADTKQFRSRLNDHFQALDAPDTSLVVFGSVARGECTSQSDLDWILLVDGQSDPQHRRQEANIRQLLKKYEFIEPGSSGVFGGMVGSHDLVHHIGGESDPNSNTTRRILLLLESLPVGHREAYDRVRRQILKRYLEDDRGLTHTSEDIRVPRFLLNDLTRYWRTITVDFVYKQVAANDSKWALRNAKLRMSRKLIFASGLALVLFCQLDENAQEARTALKESRSVALLMDYVESQLKLTPLERLAQLCLKLEISDQTVIQIFSNYDLFLGILDDQSKRDELAKASSHETLRQSLAWQEVRKVSVPFHRGLVSLFLDEHDELKKLTMDYGLF